jgi:hypothetical protein
VRHLPHHFSVGGFRGQYCPAVPAGRGVASGRTPRGASEVPRCGLDGEATWLLGHPRTNLSVAWGKRRTAERCAESVSSQDIPPSRGAHALLLLAGRMGWVCGGHITARQMAEPAPWCPGPWEPCWRNDRVYPCRGRLLRRQPFGHARSATRHRCLSLTKAANCSVIVPREGPQAGSKLPEGQDRPSDPAAQQLEERRSSPPRAQPARPGRTPQPRPPSGDAATPKNALPTPAPGRAAIGPVGQGAFAKHHSIRRLA